MNPNPVPETLKTVMSNYRAELTLIGKELIAIKATNKDAPIIGVEDRAEEQANLTLAYRHLEDCIMRLGKVCQAYDGGVNPNDKPAANDGSFVPPPPSGNVMSDSAPTGASGGFDPAEVNGASESQN